jgi:predicted RNase H-like HicB family nuclease
MDLMKMISEYRVEFEVDKETGMVTASIPDLNFTSSFGETFKEAQDNIYEAAVGYIEVLIKNKQKIPKPTKATQGTFLKISIPDFSPVWL